MQQSLPPHSVALRSVPLVRTRQRALDWLVVGALVAAGFALRAWAIRWGLPYADHPDEPALLNITLKMFKSGDLNPHWFLYPSLYFYLLLAVVTAHVRWGTATGLYSDFNAMLITTDVYTTIPEVFVWGRMLTIVLGSFTILAAYCVGQRVGGRAIGLLAALFLAIVPFHVQHSQVITTDVASGFWVLLAFGGALAIVRDGRWRSYMAAGLLAGLAGSTKYNAAMIVLPIAVAHALHWRGALLRHAPRLALAALAAIGGFALGTPYAVLAPQEWFRDLLNQLTHYGAGAHGDYRERWPIAGYGDWLWNDGLRPTFSIAALLGLVRLWRKQRPVALLWLSFALPYLLVHLMQETHFMRNLVPLIVLSALPVAAGALWIIEWAQRTLPRLAPLALPIVLLLMFVPPAAASLEWSRYKARTDSKVLADQWVRQLPRGQRIAVELNPVAWAGDPLVQPVQFITEHDLAWYRANNYRYLVANMERRDARDLPMYQQLAAESTLLQVFPGDASGQPGPRIEVLDLGLPRPETLAITPLAAQYGTQLQLLGYELKPGDPRPANTPLEGARDIVFAPGQPLQLNLTWRVLEPLGRDYALFVHVVDATGTTVAQRDALMRQEDYPSSRWQAGETVVDRADLPLPALPPGAYSVRIGVYTMSDGAALPLSAPQTNGVPLTLATIQVR